jgi:hypothetical protein
MIAPGGLESNGVDWTGADCGRGVLAALVAIALTGVRPAIFPVSRRR